MDGDIHFDFAAALLLLTVVTGAIWALDALWLARRRPQGQAHGSLIEFSRSFFPVILIVLLLRSFLVEPFRIPSGSMLPTLLVGDFILVNKYAYGIRLPVFHNQIVGIDEPERGDVIVFRFPLDPTKDFIKRVIGLPGDHVEYRDKTVFINGQEMQQTITGYYTAADGQAVVAEQFTEQLGTVRHEVLISPRRQGQKQSFEVPAGHYFVMGDNRDGSDDSRRWGFVPERNLVGKAFMIWMSWDGERMRPALDRIGTWIE